MINKTLKVLARILNDAVEYGPHGVEPCGHKRPTVAPVAASANKDPAEAGIL